MLNGFVSGLVVAWILSWFGVDIMLIECVQPFISIELTGSYYYLLFALIGAIGGAFSESA